LAGQSWNQCIHQRRLGVIRYSTHNHLRCELYSHPDLIDRVPRQDGPVTDQDLAADTLVRWEPRPQGFWRVAHARYNPPPWL
jgi:hypothetical protein